MSLRGLCKLPEGRDWHWEKLGLTLVGRAFLSKALIQLSVDGWVALPVSCLAWGDPALGSTGSMVELIMASKRANTKGVLPGLLLLVLLLLWWAPADRRFHRRPSNTIRFFFYSISYGVIAPFLWVLVWARFCLCPPRPEFLSIPVLWKSYSQILLAFKISSLGIPSPLAKSPGWETWCEVQKHHNHGRTSLVLLFSSLWVTTRWVCDLILSWLHPSYHLTVASSLSLDMECLFVCVWWIQVLSCWLFNR